MEGKAHVFSTLDRYHKSIFKERQRHPAKALQAPDYVADAIALFRLAHWSIPINSHFLKFPLLKIDTNPGFYSMRRAYGFRLVITS